MGRMCSSRSVAVASVFSILVRVCISLSGIADFISNMQGKNRIFYWLGTILYLFCSLSCTEWVLCRCFLSLMTLCNFNSRMPLMTTLLHFLFFALITVSILLMRSLYLFPSSSAFSSFMTSSTLSSSLCFPWLASTWERTASNSSSSSFIFDPRQLFRSPASFTRFSISEISALRASVLFSAALVWIHLK